MKIKIKCIFGLIVSLIACQNIIAKDRLVVDFTAAEKTVEWLMFIRTNPGYEKIKKHFMEDVAPTKGIQSIIHHWSRFRKWDNEEYFKFITLALGIQQKGFEEELPTSKYFDLRKKLWINALTNPEKIMDDIQQIKALNLEVTALKNAKVNLPDEISIDVDFYFVLFGASTAFAVGKENGMDVLQLPRLPNGKFNLDDISRTIAHEIHHNGFKMSVTRYMPIENDKGHMGPLGIMAAEGMATYYNQQPYRRYLTGLMTNKGIDEIIDAWEEKVPKLPEYFIRAEHDIQKSMDGSLAMKDVYTNWLAGLKGDAYILGTTMIKLIDEQLGHSAVMEIARDYRKFIFLYNKAAIQANKNGMNQYIYTNKLAEKLLSY